MGDKIVQMLIIDREYTAIKIIESLDSDKPILMINFDDVLYHLYKWDEIKPVKITDTEKIISNTVPDYIKACGIFRPEKMISFLDNADNTYNLQLQNNVAGYETTLP